jgi:hypothetical protein
MIYELKFLGKPTRFFTDYECRHEVQCTCGSQPLDGKTRIEVRDCPAHGKYRNPQNWR